MEREVSGRWHWRSWSLGPQGVERMGMTWYEILAERQKGRSKSDMDVVQEMDAMMMAYAAYAQAS